MLREVIIKDHGMVIKEVQKTLADAFMGWLAFKNNNGVKAQYNEQARTLEIQDTNFFTEREQAYRYLEQTM